MEDQIIIRDLRKKQFFQVDDEYLNGYAKHLGLAATGVYFSLCRHADKEQKCFPAQKLIAEELSISERTVRNAIKELIKFNIIQVKRGRRQDQTWLNNLYYLRDKSQWKKPEANNASGEPEANDDRARGKTQQEARGTHVPNKDIHESKDTHTKDTHIASKLAQEEQFDTNTYLKEMWNDKRKHIKIIALFAKAKNTKWENKEQAEVFIKRNLRSAKDLIAYDLEKIALVMKYLIEKANFKWTLETVSKYIDEDLNKLIQFTSKIAVI